MATPTRPTTVESPPQGQWTYADWERLPDDGNRYEVINGVLYMSTAPSFFHQWIVRRLDRFVGVPAEQAGLAFASVAPIGVLMPNCDPVQPDFVIVLAAHASSIRDRRIMGVPDVIVEVLSPSSIANDTDTKLKAYASAGVPKYVTVDPPARTLSVYRLDSAGAYGDPIVYNADDTMSFACLPNIAFRVGDLFADAPDTSL